MDWILDITFVLFRITPFEWDDNGEGDATNQWTISNALWFGIGSFLCQGCDILPKYFLTLYTPLGGFFKFVSLELFPLGLWPSCGGSSR